ncbi:hypothetical protein EDC18_103412 [Natranaerovirga pectinivora]|uniref:Uncharacterized protein n=1 Tax=Natranaerovirga pectinivora TaxID=682400 RepID=A0A4R3MRA9_9FIRM|nr:hypothetical protein [Natranaerovirga pectinivora]TCT15701.1 hypothetical protein EDC18_103412 [Natranaerovirga pectinivora]
MDESIINNLPQQGSQKSRKRSGLESDPGTKKKTDLQKHWDKNNKSYQSKER